MVGLFPPARPLGTLVGGFDPKDPREGAPPPSNTREPDGHNPSETLRGGRVSQKHLDMVLPLPVGFDGVCHSEERSDEESHRSGDLMGR